jgi:hypothetical protein
MELAWKLVEPIEVGEKALTYSATVSKLPAIKTSDEYLWAGKLWKSGKDLLEEINEGYDSLIKKAHELHKDALAKKARYYNPAESAVKAVKKLMSDYDAEQEKIRKAEEDRLRKIAEDEEKERQLQAAVDAEQSGNKEEAEAIIEAPVYVPPVVVQKTTPKLSGGPVYRTIWKFRIKNAALIPREYMIPNETMIGGVIRNSKGVINIPGVEAYEERV